MRRCAPARIPRAPGRTSARLGGQYLPGEQRDEPLPRLGRRQPARLVDVAGEEEAGQLEGGDEIVAAGPGAGHGEQERGQPEHPLR